MASWKLSRGVIKLQRTHDEITSSDSTIRRTDLLFHSNQCCESALVFNADPKPAFYLNVLSHKKLNFYIFTL
jgi:hypothetical protein